MAAEPPLPVWQIVRLRRSHDRSEFECGSPDLDDYLQRYARRNDASDLTRTFVALAPDSNVVLGYYSMRAGHVSREVLPTSKERRRLPGYPIGVVHLARLAVHGPEQGTGLGRALLMHALQASVRISEKMGVHAVEVQAETPEARAFYLKYGFKPLRDDELHLYLPLKVLRKLFSQD
jgi:GNAT superfamily N-acetyltransferase